MAHSILVHEPAKIYPYHLLLITNYRLPADVDRCNLERHLSDAEFEAICGVNHDISHHSKDLISSTVYFYSVLDQNSIDFLNGEETNSKGAQDCFKLIRKSFVLKLLVIEDLIEIYKTRNYWKLLPDFFFK